MRRDSKAILASVFLAIAVVGLDRDAGADTLFLPSTLGATADQLFRYDVDEAGATLTLTIPVTAPTGMVMTPQGELLVANYSSPGSITRFLDPLGTPTPNGTITAPGLSLPQEMLFRGGELLVANQGGSNILRFTFDALGNAVPNGEINASLDPTIRSLAYNAATDELFVSLCCGSDRINRYVFDVSGNASANGFITGNGMNNPHGMVFTKTGELLVFNGVFGSASISRFTFAPDGSASANGIITGNGLENCLDGAFTSWEELLVANNPGTLSRFNFDASGAALPNGSFPSEASYLNWMLIVRASTPGDLIEAACPRSAPYRNHGAYVSCVSHKAESLLASGLITEFEKDAIVSEAGRSEVGKRR